MPQKKYFTRSVRLELLDYKIVRDFARERGLGLKGFSSALRLILQDWFYMQETARTSKWFPKSNKTGKEPTDQSGGERF